MGFGVVAPVAGLLTGPAEQPVIGRGRQAQHRADDVVPQRLDAAGHEAVVSRQVARAGGEDVQVRQEVGIGAAAARVPIEHGVVMAGRVVSGHAGARHGP